MDLHERLKSIRMLALDVDGVLTDGGIYVDTDGRVTRRYNIKDGLGIKLLIAAGIKVVIITFAKNQAILHRAKMLGIQDVYIGAADKAKVVHQICQKEEISPQEVAYMGDDVIDMGALSIVGFPCAPADSVPAVLDCAVYITRAPGGQGAVRELCDLILQVQRPDYLESLPAIMSHE
ncbi:MAG: KdsC family phosphatase [bacterium]|jgi:3-deoxy-D-manno-octulosonate 8-phosphate phosphatase (KDO 8-P phosphatase)